MTVKIDGTEPNVFPAVEGVDVRDTVTSSHLAKASAVTAPLAVRSLWMMSNKRSARRIAAFFR